MSFNDMPASRVPELNKEALELLMAYEAMWGSIPISVLKIVYETQEQFTKK